MKRIITFLFAMMFANGLFSQELVGAGATFPYPLYTKMFDEYSKLKNIKVNYQGVGSGAGINQLIAKTVDFGGTDAPLTDEEKAKAGAEIIHIPTCLGAIVLTYNLPGVKDQIRLDGDTIANIFLGNITSWNDEKIQKLNPKVKLPNMSIVVVRRADSSGTTYNFTQYLSSVSQEWAEKVGVNKAPKWPVGVGGKGNPGVAAYVKQVPGSIGYVEYAFAKQNKMPVAIIQNKSGNFIDPAVLKGVSDSAAIDNFPANCIVNIVNTDAKNGYPISALTWIIIYKDLTYIGNRDKAKAIVDLIWWMIHDGQKINETLDYAKIPDVAVKAAENLLKSVVYNGEPLIK